MISEFAGTIGFAPVEHVERGLGRAVDRSYVVEEGGNHTRRSHPRGRPRVWCGILSAPRATALGRVMVQSSFPIDCLPRGERDRVAATRSVMVARTSSSVAPRCNLRTSLRPQWARTYLEHARTGAHCFCHPCNQDAKCHHIPRQCMLPKLW